jgi:hypothetical protein
MKKNINLEKLEQKNNFQNEMIQTPYLKGVSYSEHCHFQYTRQTNNKFLKKNSNKV